MFYFSGDRLDQTCVLGCLLALFACFLIPSSGLAQESADAAEPSFEQLIQDAKTAYEEEDYQEAIDLLLYAHRVQPNPRLLINVARSYEKMDKCVKSLVYYRAFVRDPDAEKPLVEKADEKLEDAGECEGYTDDLAGRLIVESEPRGAVVFVDGERKGEAPLEIAGLTSGEHEIRLEKEGRENFEKKIQLKPDEDQTIEGKLEEKKPEPPVIEPAITKPEEPTDTPRFDTRHYIAGGVAGAGVLMLGVGLVYDLVVIPSTDDERSQFTPGSLRYRELTEERSSEATIAIIGYVSGGLLLAGGGGWLTYLLLTEDTRKTENDVSVSSQMRMTPLFSQDGLGIGLSGSF